MNMILETPLARTSLAPRLTKIQPQRILVVEDDIELRRLNAKLLAGNGYQVDTAVDGMDGWEALHSNSFQLLITDHDMPRMSGLELVKKVRNDHMDLPVILASGAPPEEEMKLDPWLKLAAILLKPFSAVELLNIVQTVLRMSYPIRIEIANGRDSDNPNVTRRPISSQHWGINE